MKETLEKAIRLLGTYTANRFDIWILAGNARASCRAHVMSELLGKKTPQSKSGVNVIQDEFERQTKITGSCTADWDTKFREFCRQSIEGIKS